MVTRPAGTHLAKGNHAELVALGKKLFSDTKLSTNGLSCNSCHFGGNSYL
ncbi:MAG: cytochrome C peroxidase, partial [Comamonadaceae bacterium CG_4_9_14_0_8_um_filter_60_18]